MARFRTTQVSQLFTRVLIATFQGLTMLQRVLFRTNSVPEAYDVKGRLCRPSAPFTAPSYRAFLPGLFTRQEPRDIRAIGK